MTPLVGIVLSLPATLGRQRCWVWAECECIFNLFQLPFFDIFVSLFVSVSVSQTRALEWAMGAALTFIIFRLMPLLCPASPPSFAYPPIPVPIVNALWHSAQMTAKVHFFAEFPWWGPSALGHRSGLLRGASRAQELS